MTKWNIEIYNGSQDLTEFFAEAHKKGFYNNSSLDMLYKYIDNKEETKMWLLSNNDRYVGTIVSHSLNELGILGKGAWRICARICVLSHLIEGPRKHLTLRNELRNATPHDHVGGQFLIPACIEYVGRDKPLFISTNDSAVGKQRAVHKYWAPAWNKLGFLDDPFEIEYRGKFQKFWKFNVNNYYAQMSKERWPEAEQAVPLFS
jgi:hypothetical protein